MKKLVKGSFLIAAPQLSDPNFSRTVVLIAEHTDEGGFGLVVNRPASVKVSKLWEALTGEPCLSSAPAYVGGPVQSSAVFLLHTCEDLAEEANPVAPGLFLGNDVELLGSLIERQEELRNQGERKEIFRVFCGYSGWGEGQLDRELETGSWLVQTARVDEVFSPTVEELWTRSMEREGGIYGLFSQMPKDPDLN